MASRKLADKAALDSKAIRVEAEVLPAEKLIDPAAQTDQPPEEAVEKLLTAFEAGTTCWRSSRLLS